MMLNMFNIFSVSFLLALSAAIMPGPLLAVAINSSSHRGFIAGPLLIVGHGILELGLVALLFLGLSSLLQSELFFTHYSASSLK